MSGFIKFKYVKIISYNAETFKKLSQNRLVYGWQTGEDTGEKRGHYEKTDFRT